MNYYLCLLCLNNSYIENKVVKVVSRRRAGSYMTITDFTIGKLPILLMLLRKPMSFFTDLHNKNPKVLKSQTWPIFYRFCLLMFRFWSRSSPCKCPYWPSSRSISNQSTIICSFIYDMASRIRHPFCSGMFTANYNQMY